MSTSFSLNLRGPFVWWSEGERKKGNRRRRRVGGSRKWPVRATEGKWRLWRQTEKGREGGMKKTHREGWGWGVLCFFSWNAAPRLSAAAQKSRKTERLFLGRQTCHILAVSFLPLLFWPWLFGASGGGRAERGESSGGGGLERWQRAGRNRGGEFRRPEEYPNTKHFIPLHFALFWLLILSSSALQCSSQSTSLPEWPWESSY